MSSIDLGMQRKVTNEMNAMLVKEFSIDEVKQALDAIGDLKAPWPYRMPSLFCKEFWDVVGENQSSRVAQCQRVGMCNRF